MFSEQLFIRFAVQRGLLKVVFCVMPASVSIRVEQPSTATPSSVYDALMDLDRWPEFLPGVRAASWEVRGSPDTGVGGVRRMRLASQPVGVTRDHIVEGTRPHHHAYVAAFPWYVPLKHYRGDIRIEGVLHVSNPRPTEPRSNAPTKLCPVSGSAGTTSRAHCDPVDNRSVRRAMSASPRQRR
jgi:Polyketide cyclase / dehydrase and lipid transport